MKDGVLFIGLQNQFDRYQRSGFSGKGARAVVVLGRHAAVRLAMTLTGLRGEAVH